VERARFLGVTATIVHGRFAWTWRSVGSGLRSHPTQSFDSLHATRHLWQTEHDHCQAIYQQDHLCREAIKWVEGGMRRVLVGFGSGGLFVGKSRAQN
jgi:hypothetical protein